jgi:hypothetical protein
MPKGVGVQVPPRAEDPPKDHALKYLPRASNSNSASRIHISSFAIDRDVKPVDRDCVGAHRYYRGRVASHAKRCLDLSSHLLTGNERSIWAKEGVKKKQDNLGDFKPASAYGSLAASTSTFSMTGAVAKSSDAFAISAAATLPER